MSSMYVDLLGCEIRYYQTARYRTRAIQAGEGDVLFLMHGGGGHAEAYARNIRRLGQQFRVMAIDSIWHGFSSAPPFPERHWVKEFTRHILDLMDHLDIKKASFEGKSLTGWIAIDMALNHPDRVNKIILNTAWGIRLDPRYVTVKQVDRDALKARSIAALTNASRETIRARLEWLMPRGGVTEELVDVRYAIYTRPETKDALLKYYDRLGSDETNSYMFTDDDVAKIKRPTLILWTDHNPAQGVDTAERLHHLIPGSSMHIVRNAAHWPQWEHAEEHDRVVSEFMRS